MDWIHEIQELCENSENTRAMRNPKYECETRNTNAKCETRIRNANAKFENHAKYKKHTNSSLTYDKVLCTIKLLLVEASTPST